MKKDINTPEKKTKKGISLLQTFGIVIVVGIVLVIAHYFIYGY